MTPRRKRILIEWSILLVTAAAFGIPTYFVTENKNTIGLIALIVSPTLGIIIPRIAARFDKAIKQLTWSKNSVELLRATQDIVDAGAFDAKYKNMSIKSLTATKLVIINESEDTVGRKDINNLSQIRVLILDKSLIVDDPKIINVSKPETHASIKTSEDRFSATIEFEFLEVGDAITFFLLHTGSPDQVELKGGIIGSKESLIQRKGLCSSTLVAKREKYLVFARKLRPIYSALAGLSIAFGVLYYFLNALNQLNIYIVLLQTRNSLALLLLLVLMCLSLAEVAFVLALVLRYSAESYREKITEHNIKLGVFCDIGLPKDVEGATVPTSASTKP